MAGFAAELRGQQATQPAPDGSAPVVDPLVQAATNLASGQPTEVRSDFPGDPGVTVDPATQIPPMLRAPNALTASTDSPLVQAATNLTGGAGMGTPAPMVVPGQDGTTPPPPGMGGMPMQTGATEMTTTVQQGTPLSPELKKEVDRYQANERLQNEKARKAMGELELLYKDPAFAKALDDQSKISQEVMQSTEKYGDYLEALTKMKKDYQASLDKSLGRVDPNKFWNERSTGDKILAGISIFLGGLGAGAGGQNTALKIIDDAIARDINAQEFNIEQAQKEAAAKGEILKTEMDVREFIDRKKIERLAVADQVVLGMLKNIEARQMPIEARQRLEQMIAEKEKSALDTKIALYQMGVNKVTKSFSAKTASSASDMSKMRESWTPWGLAAGTTNQGKAADFIGGYYKTMASADAMENFIDKEGTSAWGRSEAAGLASVLSERWVQIRQVAANSGVLNPSEREVFEGNAPTSEAVIKILMSPDKARGMINATRDWYNDQAAAEIKARIPNVDIKALPPAVAKKLSSMSGGYQPRSLGGQ